MILESKDINFFEFSLVILYWCDWQGEPENTSLALFTINPYFSAMGENNTSSNSEPKTVDTRIYLIHDVKNLLLFVLWYPLTEILYLE